MVRKDLPVETMPELIRYLRERPGKLTYASAGNGTTGHIASEMFRGAAGLELVHIPYRGNAAAMTDLAAGRVDMAIDLIPAAAPLLQGGAVRSLAVTSMERLPTHPDLPTVASFLPGFEVAAWDGIFAPAGTPAPVVATINAAFRMGIKEEATVDRLRQRGAEVVPLNSPQEFAKFVSAEREKWSAAVKASGARME